MYIIKVVGRFHGSFAQYGPYQTYEQAKEFSEKVRLNDKVDKVDVFELVAKLELSFIR